MGSRWRAYDPAAARIGGASGARQRGLVSSDFDAGPHLVRSPASGSQTVHAAAVGSDHAASAVRRICRHGSDRRKDRRNPSRSRGRGVGQEEPQRTGSGGSRGDLGMKSNNESELSRRGLLAGSAFAIMSPRAVRGSQANSKISVGLVGSGNRGSYDASIVNADPRAKVTALCDLYDDRLEKAAQQIKSPGAKLYRDFEKLLASPDIDAVVIATPPFEHPRMLEAAVEARKHVYCEKPAGVDLEGVKRVIAAGRRADPKKNISFGFQQRYGPVYLEAYKRLREGQIGALSNARGFWIDRDPFTRVPYADPKVEKLRNWFCYRDYSGDFIVEQDCHNLDVLHWFLDARPVRAFGMGGRKVRTSMEIMDHLTLSFQFPNNMHVNFEANQITPRGFT